MICLCTICRKELLKSDKLADLHIYKYGELDSILLAHRSCAEIENEKHPSQGNGPIKPWRFPGSLKGDARRAKRSRRKAGLDHPVELANWEGDAVRCRYIKIQPNRYPPGLRRKAYYEGIAG